MLGRLHAVSEVTAFHIICYVVAHPHPQKFMHDKFHCLLSSRVSSYWIVVVRIDDVKPEFVVPWGVDLSSV